VSEQLRLWGSRLPRNTVQCRKCRHLIIVSETREDGTIYSEYVGMDGLCWNCSKKK
jgi:hypothetical protein